MAENEWKILFMAINDWYNPFSFDIHEWSVTRFSLKNLVPLISFIISFHPILSCSFALECLIPPMLDSSIRYCPPLTRLTMLPLTNTSLLSHSVINSKKGFTQSTNRSLECGPVKNLPMAGPWERKCWKLLIWWKCCKKTFLYDHWCCRQIS